MRVTRLVLAYLGLLALVCAPRFVEAQDVKPPTTLWTFLGFPPAHTVQDNLTNRNGNHPGLERKPPRLAIADPKNLKSPVPAIKKAAEVKAQEDLAPQKIKAIKYLATIGCGCYNRDGSITDALLAALDDCTETVRLAAADAISDAGGGNCCPNCGQHACCTKEINERLTKMAYEMDAEGCYLEPSERVRRAAMRALLACPPPDNMPDRGRELPPGEREAPPAPAPLPPAAASPTPAVPNVAPAAEARKEGIRQYPHSSRRTAQQGRLVATEVASHRPMESESPAQLLGSVEKEAQRLPGIVDPPADEAEQLAPVIVHKAVVDFVDLNKRLVVVRTDNEGQLPMGATVQASHHFLTGSGVVGQLRVIASEPGVATLQPLNGMPVAKVVRGDQIVVAR